MMFSLELCSKSLPTCSPQLLFPSVKSWKNHSKRKEVGCLLQDCMKKCNKSVHIFTFFFFLSVSLPLMNTRCRDAWLDIPESFLYLCSSSADAKKHSGFPSPLLFAWTPEYLLVQIQSVKFVCNGYVPSYTRGTRDIRTQSGPEL